MRLLAAYTEQRVPFAGEPYPRPVTGALVEARQPAQDEYSSFYRAVGDAMQWNDGL